MENKIVSELLILSLRKHLSAQYYFPDNISDWDTDHWKDLLDLIDETIEEHPHYVVITYHTIKLQSQSCRYATKCRIDNMIFTRQFVHPDIGDMHWSSAKILKEAMGIYEYRISRRTQNLFSLFLIGDGYSEFRKWVIGKCRELDVPYSSVPELKYDEELLEVIYPQLMSR